MPGQTMEGERIETIAEISDLLMVIQEMAERLTKETHGDAYSKVEELNGILHQAVIQVAKINDVANATG